MSYTIYGSKPSPFVRRIRILLEGLNYTFKEMDIYGPDAAALNAINPTNQIPVLQDGDKTIWDSRQIFYYLNEKHQFQKLSLEEENTLTAIEGAMNAAVSLILLKRSGVDTDKEMMFADRQKNRINSVLDWLRPQIENQFVKIWDFKSITLYSFLDWAIFRGIISLESRPECKAFLEAHAQRPQVRATEIPRV